MAASTASPEITAMFQQIMSAVGKSQAEIADLRQECLDLRLANLSLEKQVKDSFQQNAFAAAVGYGSRPATPGHVTPPTSMPGGTKYKSPFLSANSAPSPAAPPAQSYIRSPLQANEEPMFVNQLTKNGDIPGFYVVIPAGGAGTRLWPLSREGHPKFLLDLTLKGRSLIQATWDRLLPLSSRERTTIVAGPAHGSAISEQLPDLLPSNLFTEPGPKESMAAIGLAAAILAKRDPDAVIGSFAADHMIAGDEAFLGSVREAVHVAKENYLVTIGIAPAHPSTGFGYVRLGEPLSVEAAPNARLVSSFKEKPDARTAAAYIATGNYRWKG